MTENESRSRENRLRRAANRQRLTLQRSRRRDPRAWDYGTWQLVDIDRPSSVVLGNKQLGYGMSLDDIENYLNADRKESK